MSFVQTDHLFNLSISRFDDIGFIKEVAVMLSSKASLFESFAALLNDDVCVLSVLDPLSADITLIIIIVASQSRGEIYPISQEAKKDTPLIRNTQDLRQMLESSKTPWKDLVSMNPRWASSVMELLQIVCSMPISCLFRNLSFSLRNLTILHLTISIGGNALNAFDIFPRRSKYFLFLYLSWASDEKAQMPLLLEDMQYVSWQMSSFFFAPDQLL
jgi:hypothetical protein